MGVFASKNLIGTRQYLFYWFYAVSFVFEWKMRQRAYLAAGATAVEELVAGRREQERKRPSLFNLDIVNTI